MSDLDLVIPTFNSELTIVQTLKSIASQTSRPKSIYIVDDCSTDNTVSVLSNFATTLEFNVIKLKSNHGPWAARNAGANASQAKYISFVDSDDVLLPDHVEAHSRLLNSGFDAVATNYFDWIPESNKVRKDPRKFPNHINRERVIIKKNFVASFSSVRREVFENLEGFRPDVTEDWDFWIRFFRNDYQIAKTTSPTYLYRWRQQSLSKHPGAFAKDLNTLRVARSETLSEAIKLEIDRKCVVMIFNSFVYDRMCSFGSRKSNFVSRCKD